MGNFSLYYSSPLEVPAYAHTVREAERLGMSREEIAEYLKMMPVPPKVWNRFIREMAINPAAGRGAGGSSARKAERLPIKINRDPKLVLLPFTDYFQGFEGAKKALGAIKVEFLESPFGSIFPSEEDGHLVVNSSFVREADLESVYLDVILSLNFLWRAAQSGPESPGSDDGGFGESPVMLDSYRAMVEEARRIGSPDAKIRERLQLPEFMMSASAFRKFVSAIGLKPAG
jgi:hypothetical protein